MEPQLRSLAGRDSLPLILLAEWEKGGPHASKLLKSGATKLSYVSSLSNIRKEEREDLTAKNVKAQIDWSARTSGELTR
jgi:hypothetical protein